MKVELSIAQASTFKVFLSFKGKDHLYIAIHHFGWVFSAVTTTGFFKKLNRIVKEKEGKERKKFSASMKKKFVVLNFMIKKIKLYKGQKIHPIGDIRAGIQYPML